MACGNQGNPRQACSCNPAQIQRYMAKISGPLLAWIDIHIDVPAVPAVPIDDLQTAKPSGEPSCVIRERVVQARGRQQARFAGTGVFCNGQISARQVRDLCEPTTDAKSLMEDATTRVGLSAWAYNGVLIVARTITDSPQPP